MMHPKSFGRLPDGRWLERIRQSKNHRNGSFQNLSETPMMAEGVSYFNLLGNYFRKGIDRQPIVALPALRTDLRSLRFDSPSIIWFGHSSYLITIGGKHILVDPVFSKRASPFQYLGVKGYETAASYTVDDLPEIDILVITHDHYDHLDFNSILKLRSKVKSVYTALGVGSHLAHWGIEESRITEFDWWEGTTVSPGLELIATPSRHFSGRVFTRNKTLWTSFVLKSEGFRIFIGGDSGYDENFKTIGDQYGPFDIALLECGQYNTMWPHIHMMPEETVQASADLNARVLMPVHWGKFTLALHPWMEPVQRVVKEALLANVKITTPRIGEPVVLDNPLPQIPWWE